MNVECDQATLDELESGFRFNDAILRSMTLVKKEAITEPSLIAAANAEEHKAAKVKEEAAAKAEEESAKKKDSAEAEVSEKKTEDSE